MESFWKAAAMVVLAVILGTTLEKTEKDFSVVLSVIVSCVVLIISLEYLSDVIDFLWTLDTCTESQKPFIGILLKISGVALVTEIIGEISLDAGNHGLSKAIQILGNVVILSISLPLFESLYFTIQGMIGKL